MIAPQPRMIALEPRMIVPEPTIIAPEPRMIARNTSPMGFERWIVVPNPWTMTWKALIDRSRPMSHAFRPMDHAATVPRLQTIVLRVGIDGLTREDWAPRTAPERLLRPLRGRKCGGPAGSGGC